MESYNNGPLSRLPPRLRPSCGHKNCAHGRRPTIKYLTSLPSSALKGIDSHLQCLATSCYHRLDRNAAVMWRWTLKPEGHVASRLVATSGCVKAEEASREIGVNDEEMTGTRQAMRDDRHDVGARDREMIER